MNRCELEFPPGALRSTAGVPVMLRWLGTAGFELRYHGKTLLIDPYLSRPSLLRYLLPLRPDWRTIYRYLDQAHVIAVGHSHYDHALDVPAIAQLTGATVLGSRSTMALCRQAGIDAERLVCVGAAADQAVEKTIAPFSLTFAASNHTPIALGRVPFAGEIDEGRRGLRFIHQYRCGAVFRIGIRVAGRSIIHLGSASLPPGPRATSPCDLLLLTVPGWHTAAQLPERVIEQLAPRKIVLMHWDVFSHSLRKPIRQLPTIKMAELVKRLQRAAPRVAIGTLRRLEDYEL